MFKTRRQKHRILTFHRIVADDTPARMVSKLSGELMTQSSFTKQLKALQGRFQFVTLSDFLATAPSSPKPLATVTFDDGYADNFHNALPILQHFGIPATCFIISGNINQLDGMAHHRLARSYAAGNIELPDAVRISPTLAKEYSTESLSHDARDRFLNTSELQQLATAGVSIQSHGVSHTPFADLNAEQQKSEAQESKEALEKIVQTSVDYFAFPIGRAQHFDEGSKHALKNTGYKGAFTTIREEWSAHSDVFALPRWGMRHSATRSNKSLRLRAWQ